MNRVKYLPIYLLSLIPLPILYLFSDLGFILLYYIIRYRRAVVRENLIGSFTGKDLDEIISIEKKFYRHFCDFAFETLKILTISKSGIEKRFKMKNVELIDRLHREGRSMVLYAAHFGNWEWISFFTLYTKFKTNTFYQKLSNRYIDELMTMVRGRFGTECIESSAGFKSLLRMEQNKELSLNLMVGDQSPRKNALVHWTNFLNRETAFLIGADRIAKKLDQAVVYPSFKMLKRGVYEVTFMLLEEFPKTVDGNEIIDNYAKQLELNIQESPQLWLWSHRRWKRTKGA
ncbi:MAG: lysophospholipid acyltransferase family protein [Flavobacteriales bacterium]|nr:lysophospholipid acyltransferase family protein [Flavobacteriales bacterium]